MVATRGREKVVERVVAWIWEQQAFGGSLPGDDGQQYQVVYRGRPWGERGPDFQGAILAQEDGTLLRGDVEIHVRASDWRRHGHQRDPAYNQAVCQVVLWQDQARPIQRQDGVTIPTIELITRLVAPLAELERRSLLERPVPVVPCGDQLPMPDDGTAGRARTDREVEIGALLDRAGLARFHEHTAAFEGDLACSDPDEVLYRGALRAMGYTANTRGFELLGAALPLATLRAMAGERDTMRLTTIQAALLGVGGLLPSQRGISVDDPWPRLLEAAWARHASTLATPLAAGTWRTWRVRPENAPVRRAAGLSQLVSAWRVSDPVDRLLADLDVAERAERPTLLAARWQARADDRDFWTAHHDFGRPLATPQPWLVGAGRATEIVVNVVLPFAYALGQASGDAALSERALRLYQHYPSGPPNRVQREMARQIGGEEGAHLARGACRQQGLIHLYRHWCDARDCANCPTRTSFTE